MAPTVGAAFAWLGRLWDLARQVHGLVEAQEKTSSAIAALDKDIQHMKLEIERLKVREEVSVARAEAAASGAATVVVSTTVAEAARRIGALEERVRALPPPPV